ncbi:hypothetical protein EVAR_57677_1 [Eumeta japonica]|uniref:Uncharacterized protein n=1 Tax=Eumeta variegata TaxID=151549 RepID=A0A4C1YLB2_EUMVA|nr:hypothetical protein EVAR_57677_1 [Eumeta japonica]
MKLVVIGTRRRRRKRRGALYLHIASFTIETTRKLLYQVFITLHIPPLDLFIAGRGAQILSCPRWPAAVSSARPSAGWRRRRGYNLGNLKEGVDTPQQQGDDEMNLTKDIMSSRRVAGGRFAQTSPRLFPITIAIAIRNGRIKILFDLLYSLISTPARVRVRTTARSRVRQQRGPYQREWHGSPLIQLEEIIEVVSAAPGGGRSKEPLGRRALGAISRVPSPRPLDNRP